MAGPTRLELATSGVTGQRSNQTELRPRLRASKLYSERPLFFNPLIRIDAAKISIYFIGDAYIMLGAHARTMAILQFYPLLFAIILAILATGGTVNTLTLSQAIPKKILDWEASEEDKIYDRKTIFNYIDGGAEVYLAFDFQELFVRNYKAASGDRIVLDVYDMGSSSEAYGVFSCDREDPEAGIGQESTFGPGLLRFWQGRYFVSISSVGEEKRAEKVILKLGQTVASLLGPPGDPPPLLQLLPPEGLIKNKTSYFHSLISLNNRYFVASENILSLEKGKTDCVFAEYEERDEETTKLLIIRYPDESQAEASLQSFLQTCLPDADSSGKARDETNKWALVRRYENFVVIVFEAPSEERSESLFAAVGFPAK